MPLLTNESILAIKTESTSGTAETLLTADANINAYNVQIQPNIAVIPRQGQGANTPVTSGLGILEGTATFETDFYATATWEAELMGAMGFADSTGWTPTTAANHSHVTVGHYVNGKKQSLYGAAVESATFTWRDGEPPRVAWTLRGIYLTPSDATILVTTAAAGGIAPYINATTVIGAYNPAFSEVSVTVQNTIAMLQDPSISPSGIKHAQITGRSVTGSISVEDTLVATKDFNAEFLARTEQEISTTYSSIGFSCPKAQFTNVQQEDSDGIRRAACTFQANRSAVIGNDEIEIDI